MEYESEVIEIASALFDGGWRAADRADLMDEYALTECEASQICVWLQRFEEQ